MAVRAGSVVVAAASFGVGAVTAVLELLALVAAALLLELVLVEFVAASALLVVRLRLTELVAVGLVVGCCD